MDYVFHYNMLNKSKINKVILFALLLIFSCKERVDDSIFFTLKINNISIQPIQTNDLFSQIEYILLETLPDCLLKEDQMEVSVTDKYIIANNTYMDIGGAFLFDRKTGKFLYEIGKRGQGPGEYTSILAYPFNEKYELFYVFRDLQRIGIDINTNKEVERVFKSISEEPVNEELTINIRVYSMYNIYKMDSLLYIGYTINHHGDFPYLLFIFDKDGNIIKKYPNHQKYIDYLPRGTMYPGLFYEFDNRLYFREYKYNDTVFQVSTDTIIPHIVFDLGRKKPDYAEQENLEKNQDCIWLNYVQETTKYILFSYYENAKGYFEGYYNKENGKIASSFADMEEKRGFVHESNLYPPLHITTINKFEEVISVIKVRDMLEYIEKNNLEKYPEKFNSLKEDDNPIVVIATLK